MEKHNEFDLHIYSADDVFFEGKATLVVVPTDNGQIGVQANHRNEVMAVVPGMMKYLPSEGGMPSDSYTKDGKPLLASVSGGMIRIENNDVLILVESAERPEDIDEARARQEEVAAKEAMLKAKGSKDYAMGEATLRRAVNRLRVKRRTI